MGRPSKAAERRAQILDAFEDLIGERSLEGASLDALAERLGVRRGLVRHYMGNRDELIQALVDRLIAREREQLPTDWSGLSQRVIVDGILDDLYAAPSGERAHQWAIIRALWTSLETSPTAKQGLARLYTEFFDQLALALGKAFPNATAAARGRVAYALLSLSDGHASLEELGLQPTGRGWTRKTARQLMQSLGD